MRTPIILTNTCFTFIYDIFPLNTINNLRTIRQRHYRHQRHHVEQSPTPLLRRYDFTLIKPDVRISRIQPFPKISTCHYVPFLSLLIMHSSQSHTCKRRRLALPIMRLWKAPKETDTRRARFGAPLQLSQLSITFESSTFLITTHYRNAFKLYVLGLSYDPEPPVGGCGLTISQWPPLSGPMRRIKPAVLNRAIAS